MSEKQQLIDMGFDPVRVDWALKATKGKGLQVAMDHLVEHSEEAVPSAEEQGGDEDAMDVDEGLVKVGDTANVRDKSGIPAAQLELTSPSSDSLSNAPTAASNSETKHMRSSTPKSLGIPILKSRQRRSSR